MYQDGTREIHTLMMGLLSFCHEKLFVQMRKDRTCCQQMSKNQFKIINLLFRYEGLTATEIGRRLDIEKGSLTTMIDQLEAMDMVVRRADPDDRRRVILSLSKSGMAHMEKTMENYSALLGDLFKDVPPQEMDRFVENLRYVVDFTKRL